MIVPRYGACLFRGVHPHASALAVGTKVVELARQRDRACAGSAYRV